MTMKNQTVHTLRDLGLTERESWLPRHCPATAGQCLLKSSVSVGLSPLPPRVVARREGL